MPPTPHGNSSWSTDDSAALYRVNAWGQGYFAVDEKGHIVVRPGKRETASIDLYEVIEELSGSGLKPPILLRFSNMLTHRLHEIHEAFAAAIEQNQYSGRYFAVYPIKVNQQRSVVDEVYQFGRQYRFGLEVGSKPELLAVMAMASDADPRLIVCNGFKDDDYIETVTLAAKAGRRIVPVVEKYDELRLILKQAEAHGIRPRIGVRVKLASEGVGRWRDSSGARSKFGLFTSEVVDLFRELEAQGLEDCLELVHCHAGSQLIDIANVRDAVGELAHIYADLRRMGASGLRYLDIGGGLGIDYDGSQTNRSTSMNYTLQEYAREVVYRVKSVCTEAGVPEPTIISESGRAITAYQSVLVFNVLGRSSFRDFELPADLETRAEGSSLAPPIHDLIEAAQIAGVADTLGLTSNRLLESYHAAVQAHQQALELYVLGYLSLEERSFVERTFWSTCVRIVELSESLESPPEEIVALGRTLADTYFCNFSLFQSLPDHWAIDQLFPIAPIHRLDEKPTRHAILADMTCDSDGEIDTFIDHHGTRDTLPLHPLREGESYYVAAFLVGAYQEVLGCLHNLFGDTHVVHLELEGSEWKATEIVEGDTAAEVLSYLQYDPEQLREKLRATAARATSEGKLTQSEEQKLLAFYDRELHGYTYLGPEDP